MTPFPGGCVTGSAGKATPRADDGRPHDPLLRAKYLDYCSARIAGSLLQLSPDEIYVLAQDAVRGREDRREGPLSYDEMVQLATGRIFRRLELPDFKQWAEEYRKDPARFDREMMGLWETEGRSPDD